VHCTIRFAEILPINFNTCATQYLPHADGFVAVPFDDLQSFSTFYLEE